MRMLHMLRAIPILAVDVVRIVVVVMHVHMLRCFPLDVDVQMMQRIMLVLN